MGMKTILFKWQVESQRMAKDLVDLKILSPKLAVGESEEAMQLNTQNTPVPARLKH